MTDTSETPLTGLIPCIDQRQKVLSLPSRGDEAPRVIILSGSAGPIPGELAVASLLWFGVIVLPIRDVPCGLQYRVGYCPAEGHYVDLIPGEEALVHGAAVLSRGGEPHYAFCTGVSTPVGCGSGGMVAVLANHAAEDTQAIYQRVLQHMTYGGHITRAVALCEREGGSAYIVSVPLVAILPRHAESVGGGTGRQGAQAVLSGRPLRAEELNTNPAALAPAPPQGVVGYRIMSGTTGTGGTGLALLISAPHNLPVAWAQLAYKAMPWTMPMAPGVGEG